MSNVEKIIKYIKTERYKIDFELGNEPNSYKHKFNSSMDPQTQIGDTNRLLGFIGKAGLPANIFGPDSTGRGPNALNYLKEYIKLNPPVSALTYHHYTLDQGVRMNTMNNILAME